MKLKLIILLLFVSAVNLSAQANGIKVNLGTYSKTISSLNRKGVDFISAKELSELFGASVYFNPSNAKLEIKFANGIVKLTSQNEFVVYTSRIDNLPKVFQMPLAPVLVHNDLYIAFEFYSDLFSRAAGKTLDYNKSSKEISVDLKENRIAKKQDVQLSADSVKKPVASKNSTVLKNAAAAPAKIDTTKKAVTIKKTEVADKPDSTKNSLADKSTPDNSDSDNSDPDKSEPAAEDVSKGELKKSNSKFDIAGLTIDSKSNGTLIRLLCKKRVTRYSASITNGILYLNLLGVRADEKAFSACQPKGLIAKTAAKNIGSNSQIEFKLREGYSTYEAFQDNPGNDLLLTIHNKLLSKTSQSDKLDKWALRTVVIDAGHGGKDPGAIGVNGTKEKDVNLGVALKLGELIQDNMPDVKVIYTRSTDKFVELYKRGKIANEKNGNLFISIHCNSTPAKPTSANGFEIYLLRPGRTKEAISIAERENSVIQYEDNPSHYQKLTDENFILVSMAHSAFMRYSERFSDLLNKQFTGSLSLTSNGIKQAGFYVLVGASMPSVLVETGFISNKDDEAFLASKSGQKSIASSIFKTIQTFKEEYDRNIQMEMDASK